MKAVRIHEHGGPEVLRFEDAPDPKPKPGEVLLLVRAASVNHLDLFIRRGMPGLSIPLPRIPGADAAGVVEGTGRRVCIDPSKSCGACEFCRRDENSMCTRYSLFGEHEDGCYAERVAVPEANLIPIPDAMSFESAAAAPLVFLTAWTMLVRRGRLKAGEDVLIFGAGGGVGTACLSIARHVGARVIAAVGSEEKARLAEDGGAHAVVNSARDDVVAFIRDFTKKRGVDVVVDYVGKDTWLKSLKCLRRGGRLVTCGATTGYDPTEDLRQIYYRQLEIIGTTMGSHRDLREVMKLVFEGRLSPRIDRVLPLREAAEAHRRIEAREVFGKLVLTP